MSVFELFVSIIFVNNVVLARYLGNCPYPGCSCDKGVTVGMGSAVIFVTFMATLCTWLMQRCVPTPFELGYLQTIVSILVITGLVQFVEIFLRKAIPLLYSALGIFLPFVTTNCAVMSVTILVQCKEHDLTTSLLYTVVSSLDFILVLILMAGVHERLDTCRAPRALTGILIALIMAGLVSLAFMAFKSITPQKRKTVTVMISVLVLLGLGLATTTMLAVASRVFHIEEDPRVQAVLKALPSANYDGCDCAGCKGYTTAMATGLAMSTSRCYARDTEASTTVGGLTGKTVAISGPLVSFRCCGKVAGSVALHYDYQGMPSYTVATGLAGGSDSCSYSCLGFGNCVQVCPFDAIGVRGGLARVDASKYTGYGKCMEVCLHDMLELVPARTRVMVFCSTKDRLKVVTEVCKVGCIKRGRCVRDCPADAITLENDRIHVNHRICLTYNSKCGEAYAATCTREALRVFYPSAPPKPEVPAGAMPAPGKPLDTESTAQATPASQGKTAPTPVQSTPAAPEASPAPTAGEDIL